MCGNLIEKNNEVIGCSRKTTYIIVRKSDNEVMEALCTQHAERLINKNLIDTDYYTVRYTGSQLASNLNKKVWTVRESIAETINRLARLQ